MHTYTRTYIYIYIYTYVHPYIHTYYTYYTIYCNRTSVAQLRRAFAANFFSTRQNSHLYNEPSFDLTRNESIRGLF